MEGIGAQRGGGRRGNNSPERRGGTLNTEIHAYIITQ